MEITEEQYVRIKDSLPVQCGNVSLSNPQLLNALLTRTKLDERRNFYLSTDETIVLSSINDKSSSQQRTMYSDGLRRFSKRFLGEVVQ